MKKEENSHTNLCHMRKDGMINNNVNMKETLAAIQTTVNELRQQNEYIKTRVQ